MNDGRPTTFEGKVWVLRDPNGDLLDDVDTDQIYHNAHLAVTDVHEMGRYALGNLAGWEDFPRKAEPGDIVVAGNNFGAGSSRQHAVDCFISLGVTAILAKSFAPIYKRNAINSGLPILACPALAATELRDGCVIRVDFLGGAVVDPSTDDLLFACRKPSPVQMEIYLAGDLFSYAALLIRGPTR